MLCPFFFISKRPTNNDMKEAAEAIVRLFPSEKMVSSGVISCEKSYVIMHCSFKSHLLVSYDFF
jgi:hypothetical protein